MVGLVCAVPLRCLCPVPVPDGGRCRPCAYSDGGSGAAPEPAPCGGGPATVPAGHAEQLHPGAADAERRGGVFVHCVPPRAHRTYARAHQQVPQAQTLTPMRTHTHTHTRTHLCVGVPSLPLSGAHACIDMLIDFSDALQTNVFVLGDTFLKFSRLLSLRLPVVDPSLYIHRFAARLQLGDKTHAVPARPSVERQRPLSHISLSVCVSLSLCVCAGSRWP
jgi:hypothetical protein